MKILLSLFAIMMLTKECDQTKTGDTSTTEINTKEMSEAAQDFSKVSYETTTRGFYERVWITKESIIVTKDRNHMENDTYPTPEADWNALVDLMKNVDLAAMPELEAPTTLRFHDGAAIATLEISQNKTDIKSSAFDNGYPPKAIEAIVNKVISMKKIHEKN